MPRGNPQPWLRRFKGRPPCWYVQVGGQQVRLSTDRAEAFRMYHRVVAERQSARASGAAPAPGPGLCLGDVLEAYLAHVEVYNSPKTFAMRRGYLRSFALFAGVGLPAASLGAHLLTAWVAGHPGWSASTRRIALVSVKQAAAHAARSGLLAASPLAGVRVPGCGRRERALDEPQYAALLGAARPEGFRDLVEFCWETGCRPQEARLLEAAHLAAEGDRAVLPLADSKGRRHRRVIYFTPAARALAERLRAARPDGRLFRNSGGRPWTTAAVQQAFARARRSLGAPVKLCLYDLRHSFATRALRRGLSVAAVAELMGHKSPAMVLDVYQHLGRDEEYLRRELGKLS